ncbi:hypothetical protein [Haloferula sp. BvORR071]|uniref:hypothetical protein n=1 Tax=Haloferula sp. BvORR071 TaxID=1396141 RepID=UPI002240F104|nr:hypothetical protein [Haloferula sp. BvORR071]
MGRWCLESVNDAKTPDHKFVDLQPADPGTADYQAANRERSDGQGSDRHRR